MLKSHTINRLGGKDKGSRALKFFRNRQKVLCSYHLHTHLNKQGIDSMSRLVFIEHWLHRLFRNDRDT
jgi:hypothetical protein